eukprot:3940740-Rhodomonas_salina.2
MGQGVGPPLLSYAVAGTDLGYAAMHTPVLTCDVLPWSYAFAMRSPAALLMSYAKAGTDIGDAATR